MKNANATALLAAMSLSVATAACSQNQAPADGSNALGPGSVATVNGKPIAESVLRIYALATEGKSVDELTADQRSKLVDDLIGVELLSQQAEKEGLTTSRAIAAQLELQRLQFVARAMATSYLEKNPATNTELEQIYQENLSRLGGRQFKARHILVTNKEEADAVIAELRGGKNFLALAQEHANGPTGPNGGDLGWFTTDSIVQPVADAVRTMQVGTYSTTPVQTEYGFHVLLLEDTRQQEAPALADIRTELAGAVERRKLEEYLTMLRGEAEVSRD